MTAMLALAAAALWPAAQMHAQLPMPASTLFEITGFIQSATLETAGDAFSGGTLTMNNHVVVIPRNTIFQMPATSLTWTELFTKAPAPWGPKQSGLALSDTPKPAYTFEVTVQGNRIGDKYIAALVFISSMSLQQHQGFISGIDYVNGELIVGGSRVRLNDPVGRFDGGRKHSHDVRFTIDEDNPTVKSETGYPMCIPGVDPTQGDDPLCPQGNRPGDQKIFTMATPPAPSAAQRQNPALRDLDGTGKWTPLVLDPWRAAPFKVGDYVTVRGPIVKDDAGQYISATAVDANVGIFTAPHTQPTYVSVDVVLMGTGPVNDVTLAQEGAKRTIVEGFTTDATAPVTVSAIDVDACTGEGLDRFWNMEAIDPGPPNGAVQGRWRFRPGAPLFDLKGFPFLPPTREVHAVSNNGTVITMNGLVAGEYTAPNFEFILPENRGIGSPIVPGNFETMAFLTQGSGPRGGSYTGQLSPWPGEAAPVRNACAVVAGDQVVKGGSVVTLDGSQSVAANVPANTTVSYKWAQVGGSTVALNGSTTPTATFTAPTVALGSTAALAFQLTATPANGSGTVQSRVMTVTVTNPDVTAPSVAAPTTSPNQPLKGKSVTLSATATDNVAVTGLTFFYSYTLNGLTQTVFVTGNKPATGTTWTSSAFTMPNVASTYTYWAVASDAAGNQAKSAVTTKTVQ
jgi:hypothetical protein